MLQSNVAQPLRYTFLLLELFALLVANRVAFDSWIPTSEPPGLWFYAALFGLLLGHRLGTPFFTAPKDAVLYAIPALIALFQVPDGAWASNGRWGQTAYVLLVGWIVLVLVSASTAIWLFKATSLSAQSLALASNQVSASLGNPRAFFSVIFVLVLLAFPPSAVEGLLLVFLAWAITVPFSLLDHLYLLVRRLRLIIARLPYATQLATIASFQVPGLLLIRVEKTDALPLQSVIAFRDTTEDDRLAYVTNHAGRDDGVLLRAIDIGGVDPDYPLPELDLLAPLQALLISDERLSSEQRARVTRMRLGCLGFVAPETDIGRLIIEVVADRSLEAGQLVKARSSAEEMYYQLTNGITKEEIVQQKSTYGFVTAHAHAVGVWMADEAKFRALAWVPSPNSPVELIESNASQFAAEHIGCFPRTDFGVRIRNVDHLVTHNTAILGILGVGKSTLSMELVERALSRGTKVIVIDLTDQYASELVTLLDPSYINGVFTRLDAIGRAGRTNVKQNVEDGGSRTQFAGELQSEFRDFMRSGHRLLVLNPASFEVWKQDSKMFSGNASMASLTACEVAHLVSEAALKVVQEMGRTDKARLCLVLEEAHSLVPEWNATVSEGDRASANGTARAVLQGRKYGLGCIVVTQRTASVTKTILNQCNSVFAMRSFDDTSKEFLSNYIGRDYASLLPNLPERHAIFFGRASSCENPIHIQLNDRAAFIAEFRAASLS